MCARDLMPMSRQRVGAIYLAFSVVAGLACLRLLWGSADNLLQFAAAIGCGAIAYFLGRAGRRRRTPVFADLETIIRLAEHHEIPLAIYLRRFHDDARTFGASLEEQIALGLGSHALFVAIGRPGEDLPTEGAFRLYVGDDEWRNVVQELLSVASLILLRWAPGGHLDWELEQVSHEKKLHRTAFVLPMLPQGAYLEDFLPETVIRQLDDESLRQRLEESPALLTIQQDGSMSLLRVPEDNSDRDETPLERLASAFAEGLALPELGSRKATVLRRLYGRSERIALLVGTISAVIPTAVILIVGIVFLDAFTPFDIIPMSWNLDLILSVMGWLVLVALVVIFLGALFISKLTGRS